MKLVKALKKTKKISEPPKPGATENKPILSEPLPARTAPVAPQAKLNLSEIRSTEPATPELPKTTIEALIDVGFGNQLFLRGQGAGLSWDRGTPLECVDGQTWRWSAPTADKLTFKLLLNDKIWAQGEDIVASPGKCIGVVPKF